VSITVEGDRIDGEVTITENGVSRVDTYPRGALPDCESCEKPDLLPQNYDAVRLYHHVQDQHERGPMHGEYRPIRMSDMIATANWLYEAGVIDDIDTAIPGAKIIGDIRTRIINAEIEAKAKADRANKS
jgi:hypothetical protein